MVESYPTFQVSSFSARPESVLALPAHSIYSSQTQPGDQLVLCVAEEMERQLQELTDLRAETANVHDCGRGAAAGKAAVERRPGTAGAGKPHGNESQTTPQAHEMDLTYPGTSKIPATAQVA